MPAIWIVAFALVCAVRGCEYLGLRCFIQPTGPHLQDPALVIHQKQCGCGMNREARLGGRDDSIHLYPMGGQIGSIPLDRLPGQSYHPGAVGPHRGTNPTIKRHALRAEMAGAGGQQKDGLARALERECGASLDPFTRLWRCNCTRYGFDLSDNEGSHQNAASQDDADVPHNRLRECHSCFPSEKSSS